MKNKILKVLLFSFIFFSSPAINSLEFRCDFEEVHFNGTVNQGIVLLKKNKLRYEYKDENLFIIFVDGEEVYLFDKKKQNIQIVKNNLDAIKIIMMLANQYPNIKTAFEENDVKINIEFNSKNRKARWISPRANYWRLS